MLLLSVKNQQSAPGLLFIVHSSLKIVNCPCFIVNKELTNNDFIGAKEALLLPRFS